MAITANNFIVVYELGDINSAEFATYYANKHGIDTTMSDPSADTGVIGGIDWEVHGQLLGIKLSDDSEILSSESVFATQLLNPISDALQSSTLQNRNIWGIVLGYNIPGGFRHGPDIVSSTSRISRLNSSFSKKIKNKLYNRSIFQRFDATDANVALICSRIDAPNLLTAKIYVDNAEKLNNQLFANGTFYIDPYSDRATTGAGDYQELVIDFKDNLLPSLNLESWSTTFMDPYIDVVIPFVENDSFIWSWFTNRATTSFFQYSNALRVFCYNGDYDGAYTVRDENGKRWCYLALNAGYVATAGAMSNPSIPGFLNPNAFFNALLRGATIGEAYLFSVPYLDWTMTLLGDPLTYCSFPSSEVPNEDLIDEHEVWDMMSRDLARTAAHLYKKEDELRDILDIIVDLDSSVDGAGVTGLLTSTILLYPAYNLYNINNEVSWHSELKPLVDRLFDFPHQRYYYYGSPTLAPNIDEYLSDHNFKVSGLLSGISGGGIIGDNNLLEEGWWQFEFLVYDDDPNNFINYHFKLEVSDDEDFNNILMTKDSYTLTNWTYEKSKDTFVPIAFDGVTSSYIGRRVRYESRQDVLISIDEYLTRGETYYFRVTQYNLETSEEYDSREYNDIIYS